MHESELGHTVAGLVVLLIIAAATQELCKHLKLPLTIMLVLIGIGLAWTAERFPDYVGLLSAIELTPDLMLYVFLPTLIFESALSLDVRQLQRNLLPVLTLAVPGLLLSTSIIGALVWLATPLEPAPALLLGAILSATDPVAVISLFKQLGTPGRLTVLVEGESLLNDATALVLARLLVGIIVAGSISMGTIAAGALDFIVVFFGGIIVGWLSALVVSWAIGHVEGDAFIEITLTTVLAYCSFLIAEEVFHVSGIMATLAAGITLAGWGRAKISPSIAEFMEHFWKYLAFLANALIFLLVGLQINLLALWDEVDILLWVVLAMLLSRFIVIYGLVPLVGRIPGAEAVERDYQTVMFWGGLRGAIALAIVLSLPRFEYSALLETLVMGAVLFTLVVQGLTIEWLIRFLNLNKPPLADRLAYEEGLLHAQQHLLAEIPALEAQIHFSPRVAEHLKEQCQKNIDTVMRDIQALNRELRENEDYHLLLTRCLAKEKSSYYQMFCDGHLTGRSFRELDHLVAEQITSLRFLNRLPKDSFGRFSSKRIHRAVVHWFGRIPLLDGIVQRMRITRMTLDYDTAWGRVQAGTMVLEALDDIAASLDVSPDTVSRIRQLLERWHEGARELLGEMAEQFPEFVVTMQTRVGERLAVLASIEAIESQARGGTLPEAVAERLIAQQHSLLRKLRGPVGAALKVPTLELLRRTAIFRGLPNQEFEELTCRLIPHTVPRHEILIHPGERISSLFLIARGAVAVYDQRQDKKTHLATYQAGDCFGGESFAHNHLLAAQAVIPSSIYELRKSDFDALCERHPSIRLQLTQMQEQGTAASETRKL